MIHQEIDIKATPVYYANKQAYDSGLFRLIANQGSTRSSKTYSICQLLTTISTEAKKTISVCSHSLPHLKKGARRDFLEILEDWELFNEKDFNRTDNIYNFPQTGSYVEFFGAENADKVRGPGRDILYVNELNLLQFSTYTQLAMRTRETIFADWNPAEEFSFVYDLLLKDKTKYIHSTYKNNRGNLTPEQIEEIEYLQQADQNLWRVYGLGLRGTSKATIYTHWKTFDRIEGGDEAYGLDFGYNVPTSLAKCNFKDNCFFSELKLYETKLTNTDLIERLKPLIPNKRTPIYADAAEPQRIEEIRRAGFNIQPADKSVKPGIDAIKSVPFFIHSQSTEGIKEVKSYKWKEDINGNILDEPVKFNDHWLDATRYAGKALIKSVVLQRPRTSF